MNRAAMPNEGVPLKEHKDAHVTWSGGGYSSHMIWR